MPYPQGYIQKVKEGAKTDAKGLEKVIVTSSQTIQSVSYKVNTIFYGKPDEMSEANEGNKRLRNVLDMGVIPLLDILTSVDACELVNYALDKLRSSRIGASTFDPNKRPTDTFGIVKWTFQKAAFDVQTQIDGFYNEVGDISSLNVSNGAKLLNIITNIKNEFRSFTDIVSSENPSAGQDITTLLSAFPQLRNVGNYINDSVSFFDRYSDFRQLRNEDIQRAINTINKIRQYCVLIQSLNNPTSAALAIAQGPITTELNKLLKNIDVQKLVPTLKSLSQSLKNIASVLNSIKSVIDTARLLLRVFMSLIYVFRLIVNFFRAIPLPNQFTTVGVTNTFSSALTNLNESGPNTLEVRMSQINTLLGTVTLFLNNTLPIVNEILQKINTLIANIERCKDSINILPKEVLDDLKNSTNSVQNATNNLQAFLDEKKQNDETRSSDSQIGQFTIKIITEEVIEENFGLRRRYGVALNNRGILQVQSQPTFASDNNVIINEVKLLLQQNGLIKEDTSIYTDSEINTINESRSYLADDNLNIYPEDTTINEDGEDSSIASEIREFVTQSRRGRRLLNRSRRKLQQQRAQLNRDLGTNSPSSTTKEQEFEVKAYTRIPPSTLPTFLLKTIKIKAETDKQALDIAKEELDPDDNKNYRYEIKKLS